MESGPISSWQIDEETMERVADFMFLGSKITAYGDCSHEIKRCLLLRRKAMINVDSILKSRDITLPTKVRLVKAMVVMYGCESWTIKKAECQRIDVFELWYWRRLLRVPWNAGGPTSHHKGNQSWIFIGTTDVEAETPNTLATWCKNWLIGKDLVSGKDWKQEEKGTTEDEIVGWHHWLNGHEFMQAPGVGDGQGSLACCSPCGRKESDMPKQLNWSELMCRMNNYRNVWLHVYFSSAIIINTSRHIWRSLQGAMAWWHEGSAW